RWVRADRWRVVPDERGGCPGSAGPRSVGPVRLYGTGRLGRGVRLVSARARVRVAVRRGRGHGGYLAVDRGRVVDHGHGRAVEVRTGPPCGWSVGGVVGVRVRHRAVAVRERGGGSGVERVRRGGGGV